MPKNGDESRLVAMHSVILCVLLLIVCAAYFYDATHLPEPVFEPLGAALVPQALCVIVATLAIIQLTKSVPPALAKGEAGQSVLGGQWYAIVTLVFSIAYVGAMTAGVPFRWSTFFYLLALGAVLTRFDIRRTAVMAGLALIMAFGLHYLLIEVFYVNLP